MQLLNAYNLLINIKLYFRKNNSFIMRKRIKIFEHPVLSYSFLYFFCPLHFFIFFFSFFFFSSPLIHHSVIEERERSNFLPFGKRKCFLHNGRKAIVVPFNKNSRLERKIMFIQEVTITSANANMRRAVCGKSRRITGKKKIGKWTIVRIQLHGFILDYNPFKGNLISLCFSPSVNHLDCFVFILQKIAILPYTLYIRIDNRLIPWAINIFIIKNYFTSFCSIHTQLI